MHNAGKVEERSRWTGLIYISMTGAQSCCSSRLSRHTISRNTSTTGYKAETRRFAPLRWWGRGCHARICDRFDDRRDFAAGTIQSTGRDFDVAVEGEGTDRRSGTRRQRGVHAHGSFGIDPEGQLQTRTGLLVWARAARISIPQAQRSSIGRDGTVSATITANPRRRYRSSARSAGQSAEKRSYARRRRTVSHSQKDSRRRRSGGCAGRRRPRGEQRQCHRGDGRHDQLARQFDLHMKMLSERRNKMRSGPTQLLAASPQ